MTPPDLTDRIQLARQRQRAVQNGAPALFLHEEVRHEVQERLNEVNKSFNAPVVITPFATVWAGGPGRAAIAPEAELLNLESGAHDLVIHALCLHWANDPVGQLIQARRTLQPDGLCIAALFGGQTLAELRTVLAEAETQMTGGISPRVAPMGEVRDLGSLLQRAGFALPVADTVVHKVSYRDMGHLVRDLRAMGEGNALSTRNRQPMPRRLFNLASTLYHRHYPAADGRITATFEIVYLTGWAPDERQQKPLRPGSASARLADALGTAEKGLVPPQKNKPD